jgi:hypothetical protein
MFFVSARSRIRPVRGALALLGCLVASPVGAGAESTPEQGVHLIVAVDLSRSQPGPAGASPFRPVLNLLGDLRAGGEVTTLDVVAFTDCVETVFPKAGRQDSGRSNPVDRFLRDRKSLLDNATLRMYARKGSGYENCDQQTGLDLDRTDLRAAFSAVKAILKRDGRPAAARTIVWFVSDAQHDPANTCAGRPNAECDNDQAPSPGDMTDVAWPHEQVSLDVVLIFTGDPARQSWVRERWRRLIDPRVNFTFEPSNRHETHLAGELVGRMIQGGQARLRLEGAPVCQIVPDLKEIRIAATLRSTYDSDITLRVSAHPAHHPNARLRRASRDSSALDHQDLTLRSGTHTYDFGWAWPNGSATVSLVHIGRATERIREGADDTALAWHWVETLREQFQCASKPQQGETRILAYSGLQWPWSPDDPFSMTVLFDPLMLPVPNLIATVTSEMPQPTCNAMQAPALMGLGEVGLIQLQPDVTTFVSSGSTQLFKWQRNNQGDPTSPSCSAIALNVELSGPMGDVAAPLTYDKHPVGPKLVFLRLGWPQVAGLFGFVVWPLGLMLMFFFCRQRIAKAIAARRARAAVDNKPVAASEQIAEAASPAERSGRSVTKPGWDILSVCGYLTSLIVFGEAVFVLLVLELSWIQLRLLVGYVGLAVYLGLVSVPVVGCCWYLWKSPEGRTELRNSILFPLAAANGTRLLIFFLTTPRDSRSGMLILMDIVLLLVLLGLGLSFSRAASKVADATP